MQLQIDISFDQLLRAVKTLPKSQLQQLKAEIEKEAATEKPSIDLETLLLNGPVATQKQLDKIDENRKHFDRIDILTLVG